MLPKKNNRGEIIFTDYPDFIPNLTPTEIFNMGSFGGTYWRPIYSNVTNKQYIDEHLKYPKSWWKGISKHWLVTPWNEYNKKINKYNVSVGTTLEFWENSNWITEHHPYGWVNGIVISTKVKEEMMMKDKLKDGYKQPDLKVDFGVH